MNVCDCVCMCGCDRERRWRGGRQSSRDYFCFIWFPLRKQNKRFVYSSFNFEGNIQFLYKNETTRKCQMLKKLGNGKFVGGIFLLKSSLRSSLQKRGRVRRTRKEKNCSQRELGLNENRVYTRKKSNEIYSPFPVIERSVPLS